jgi:hypothetical protein
VARISGIGRVRISGTHSKTRAGPHDLTFATERARRSFGAHASGIFARRAPGIAAHQPVALRRRVERGTPAAALHVMKYLKKLIIVSSLISTIGACYVEARPAPRYAYRTCAYGWHWDGYRCHRNHVW